MTIVYILVAVVVMLLALFNLFFPGPEICSCCGMLTPFKDLACSEKDGGLYVPGFAVCKECYEEEFEQRSTRKAGQL